MNRMLQAYLGKPKMGTKLNYITFVSKEKSSKRERENWRSFSPM
jgi:hypothetical protein